MSDWNRAPERTQAEVIETLRGAAAAEAALRKPVDDMPWFWGPGGPREHDNPAKRVVVEGEYYLIDDNSREFGGRRFTIVFFDRRPAAARNLSSQGSIPPQ
ncbi:hypothetical protein OG339_48550 (plasmid) [Streptosporangium sp. NBC_01495]|uniref:hypothetical protein n=1 Tax=Streptosporangium sp. NBC_01495 TaxID=2903899 RepID=UPI002E379D95|nr:hypothetical protein [Streptosporangium sp. NBC_01495]